MGFFFSLLHAQQITSGTCCTVPDHTEVSHLVFILATNPEHKRGRSLPVRISGYPETKRHSVVPEVGFPAPPCACCLRLPFTPDSRKRLTCPAQLCFMLTTSLHRQRLAGR